MKYVLILAILLTSMLVSVAQADVEFNNSNNWSGTSGSMIPHGDGLLRAPPSVTTGLVSYWDPGTDVGSGNTLTDIWGVNDGTIHGATWNMTSGMLEYNGTSDYVTMGDVLDMGLSDLTISAGVQTSQGNVLSGIVGKHISAGVAGRYGLFTSTSAPNKAKTIFGPSASAVAVDSLSDINDGQFHHIVSVYDRNGPMYIYIDGVSENSADISSYSAVDVQLNSALDIGIYRDGGGGVANYFNGSIGSIFIYNITLTNNQINETNDNYHTLSSYREIDTVQDSGAYDIWDTIQVTGTDVGANTSITIYINGSDDNVVFNGLELIGTYDVNDLVDIPVDKEYRYAKFRIISTTTHQPETNIINNIELVTRPFSPITSGVFVLPYSDEAYVMWTIDRLSNNFVEYSLNSDMSASSYSTWDNTTTEPTILLNELTRDTTYYYEVTSVYYDNSSTSSTLNFTTQNNTHGFTYYFDRAFVVNDIDGWSVGQSMFEAYADSAGEYITWTLILGSVFLAITIRTESVIIPAVLALISAVVVFPLLPPEHDIPAKVLLGLAISGIIWHQFIGRR